MLSKQFRGLKSSEVSQLFQGQHHSVSNRFFRLIWMRSDDTHPRFVVITSGKFHKSAVVRNRSRRMLYDLLRRSFSRWTEGVRVAIVVKTTALQASKKEIQDAFHDLMNKAGLM